MCGPTFRPIVPGTDCAPGRNKPCATDAEPAPPPRTPSRLPGGAAARTPFLDYFFQKGPSPSVSAGPREARPGRGATYRTASVNASTQDILQRQRAARSAPPFGSTEPRPHGVVHLPSPRLATVPGAGDRPTPTGTLRPQSTFSTSGPWMVLNRGSTQQEAYDASMGPWP